MEIVDLSDNKYESCNEILRRVLLPISCGSLVNKKFDEPIILETQMTVSEAAETLSNNFISSAPVYDPMSNAIEFMFDFRDICTLMIDFLQDEEHMARLKANIEFSFLISDVTIEAAKSLSNVQGFRFCHTDDCILKAIPVFGSGIHRIAVVDGEGGFLGIISQSDAILCINRMSEHLLPVLSRSLESFKIARKSSICCNINVSVLEALVQMQKNNVSSVGLVDEECNLLGVISMSDIRHIFKEKAFHVLKSSCQQFMSDIRVSKCSGHSGKASYPIYAVRPDASLLTVVRKLVATRSHRIFVTENEKPVGVVSLTDILKAFIQ